MAAEELAIGIDMGGTSIKYAVVQGGAVVYRAATTPTREYPEPERLIAEIGRRLKAIQGLYPAVRAVGMGLPGFVDHEAGRVDFLTNVPGWVQIPIRDILQGMTGLPVAVDNDANCMAYAEWKLGAAVGLTDVVCLTLGTGVGGGIVAGGRFLRGHGGVAGELGQTSIDYRGRVGCYGNSGAVEDYIGNAELALEARMAYAAAGQNKTAEELTPLALELAAKDGCPVAAALWDAMARKLATCLMNCHYILNPQAFVIGGGIAKAGELLFAPLRRWLRSQMFPAHYEKLQILPAKFANDAGIIGAATLALNAANHCE